MNLSSSAIEECRTRNGNAKPRDDRPDYVNESLATITKVGYVTGLPVVEPDEDFETPLVVDSVAGLYDHYPDEEELLWPTSRDFLTSLYDSDYITNDADAAKELAVNVARVKEARELFNIDLSQPDEAPNTEWSKAVDGMFVLPSGERFDVEYIQGHSPVEDARLLTQMMAQDGMGVNEVFKFVNAQDFECQERDIRIAAYECGLVTSQPPTQNSNAMTLGPNDKVDDHPQTGMFTSKNYDPSRNH